MKSNFKENIVTPAHLTNYVELIIAKSISAEDVERFPGEVERLRVTLQTLDVDVLFVLWETMSLGNLVSIECQAETLPVKRRVDIAERLINSVPDEALADHMDMAIGDRLDKVFGTDVFHCDHADCCSLAEMDNRAFSDIRNEMIVLGGYDLEK